MAKSADMLHFPSNIVTTFIYVLFSLTLFFDGASTYKEKIIKSIIVGLNWIYSIHPKWVSFSFLTIYVTLIILECAHFNFYLYEIVPSIWYLQLSFYVKNDILPDWQ